MILSQRGLYRTFSMLALNICASITLYGVSGCEGGRYLTSATPAAPVGTTLGSGPPTLAPLPSAKKVLN